MKKIGASAVASGILCGIWTYVAIRLSVTNPDLFAPWLGFVGTTSFFVAGANSSALVRSSVSNVVGVIIGCVILALGSLKPDGILFAAIVTGFFTFVICYLVHIDLLKYSTCTFMGGFSAFATGGNWKMMILCLLIGNLVGYLCVKFGDVIYKATYKEDFNQEEWTVLKFFDD